MHCDEVGHWMKPWMSLTGYRFGAIGELAHLYSGLVLTLDQEKARHLCRTDKGMVGDKDVPVTPLCWSESASFWVGRFRVDQVRYSLCFRDLLEDGYYHGFVPH